MPHPPTAVWRAARIDSDGFPYSFSTGFEDGATPDQPEALLAAAHAGCFSRSLIAELEALGMRPHEIRTTATVSLRGVYMVTTGVIERDGQAAAFHRAALNAIKNCPIPKPFKEQITLFVEVPIEETKATLAG